MRYPDAKLIIFAKTPELGKVKTRLIPLLGEQGALDFHVASLRLALEQRVAMNLSSVVLYLQGEAPQWLSTLCGQLNVDIAQQRGEGLGERMLHAATEQLSLASRIVLSGTDCLTLSGQRFSAIYETLGVNDAAIIGADDGGYVALGLTQVSTELFTRFSFGNDQVYKKTIHAMRALDWRFAELDKTWDVDRPEDIRRLGLDSLPQGESDWYAAIKTLDQRALY